MSDEKQIRFEPPQEHYPFWANAEPLITFPTNSRCDDAALKAERRRFENTFKIVFGVSPDEYHLKE